MASLVMWNNFDEVFETYDSLFRDAANIYQQCLSCILYQQAENQNLKNRIERLEKEMKQKDIRFKEVLYLCQQVLKDDSCFLNYHRMFSELLDQMDEISSQLLKSQGELKKKKILTKDLEINIGDDVAISKSSFADHRTENCHLNESLVETSAQDLFSSFYMGHLYDHRSDGPSVSQQAIRSPSVSGEISENTTSHIPANYGDFFDNYVEQACISDSNSSQRESTPRKYSLEINGSTDEIETFTCDGCRKEFLSKRQLRVHIRKNVNICWPNKRFTFRKSITHESRTSTQQLPDSNDIKAFLCDGCDKKFLDKKRLRGHIQKNHVPSGSRTDLSKNLGKEIRKSAKTNVFKCRICNKVFKWKSRLEQHIRMHNGERPFACKFCGKTFTQSSGIAYHKRIHNGERPFACKFCGKTFTQSSGLAVHKRIHNGERPFACKFCSKTFTQSSGLAYHKRIHNGERPFACKFCGKTFSQSSGLANHKRIHNGERPFACKFCGKTFTQSSGLAYHKRIHNGERPFACAFCEETFRWKYTLKNHIEMHMRKSKLIKRKTIPRFLRTKNLSRKALLSPKSKKPFTCDTCNIPFRSERNLMSHQKSSH